VISPLTDSGNFSDQIELFCCTILILQKEYPMPNWDYLHLVCEEGRPRYVNGQEIPNWQQGPTLFEAVNHLFLNGWELVDNPFTHIALWYAYRPGIPHHFRRRKNSGVIK
jgi:hypothetical protein